MQTQRDSRSKKTSKTLKKNLNSGFYNATQKKIKHRNCQPGPIVARSRRRCRRRRHGDYSSSLGRPRTARVPPPCAGEREYLPPHRRRKWREEVAGAKPVPTPKPKRGGSGWNLYQTPCAFDPNQAQVFANHTGDY